MAVGMFVTVKAVSYQMGGQECHVNKTNSVLGLTMYFSYFVLFFMILIEKYCCKERAKNGHSNGNRNVNGKRASEKQDHENKENRINGTSTSAEKQQLTSDAGKTQPKDNANIDDKKLN